MKKGDLVQATWYDGLILIGRYECKKQGYVVLIDEAGEQIVCNPFYVRFEVVNESR